MPSREKSCGAIVYHERDGARKYLLVQQKFSLNWGFAKGHVEKGEDERATAMREVAEETGLAVDLDHEFRTQAIFYDRARNSKLVVLFLAKALTLDATPGDDVEEVAWLSFQDARKRLRFKNTRSILERVERLLIRKATSDAGNTTKDDTQVGTHHRKDASSQKS